MERLPAEVALTEQTRRFKPIGAGEARIGDNKKQHGRM